MNLQAVFAYIQEKNITLSADNGELVVSAAQGIIDADVMALLKRHKQELLSAIQQGQIYPKNCSEGGLKNANRDRSPYKITPDMLPLVSLSQEQIDRIAASVAQGAANIRDIYPLAPLQEGILFHHLLESQGDPYLLRSVVAFEHRTDLDAFLAALQTVINRHDILRSAVYWLDLPQPVQVVYRQAPLFIEQLTLDRETDALQQLLAHTDPRHRRLDLQRAPLLAAYIVAEPHSGEWLLALLNHHIVCDHITLEFIIDEIQSILQGRADTPSTSLPFRNFIAQARAVSPAEHEAYFRRQLGDIDEPTAPFERLNVQGSGELITEAKLTLNHDLAQCVRDTARQQGVTAAVLFHVAWAQVLAQCTGRVDVVFGTVLSGRLQGSAGADKVLGMFINTLPLRITLADGSVEQIVGTTYRRLGELLIHEQASLALAQRCSGVAAAMPLFTSLLNYRHSQKTDSPADRLDWNGMRIIHVGEERTNYPITVSIDDFGQGFSISAQCIQGIDPERIAAYLGNAVAALVNALDRNPQALLRTLNILPAAERRQLLPSTIVDYPQDQCIHRLFEHQAEKSPDAVALVFEDSALTYRELNIKANRLAHRLLELGIRPDDRVAICVERGLDMAVGLLGILKAGGAYVPLDPGYPHERLVYMLEDSAPAALLSQAALQHCLPHRDLPLVLLDTELTGYSDHNPDPATLGLTSRHLAYVIYTSGSTGLPKGVMIEHASVTRLFAATDELFHFGANDVWTLFHSFAFDFSVWELWGALLYGGRLVIVPYRISRAPDDFYALLCRERVTVLNQTPSAFRQLIAAQALSTEPHTLRSIIFGGEALTFSMLAPWLDNNDLERTQLINMYGITEITVHATYYKIKQSDLHCAAGSVIGKPLPDLRFYILDAGLQPAPLGVAGEIYIGGAGLARAYLNRPELSEQRFIRNPFVADSDARLYKTGDLGRWLPDGAIEYLGRNDFQVKIRGFRIELGEIEALLSTCPGVREAAVIAREDKTGDKRLVAYLSAQDGAILSAAELRGRLAERLPDYMLPGAFVILPVFPLTANGKLDRQALPEAEGDMCRAAAYEAPQGPVETALARIWQELLGLKQVGREDDFFEVGGHSLLAVQLLARLRQQFNVEVALREVFAESTLKALAQAVSAAGLACLPPLARADRSRPLPLSWPQQRLWFLDRLDHAAGAAYHISAGVRLQGGLDRNALQAALDRIVARHESLRTCFVGIDGQPIQVVLPEDAGFNLQQHDLRCMTEREQATDVNRIGADEAARPFDLSIGPLIRGRLLQLADDDCILLITQHHIISDGWSTGLLVRELSALYSAFSQNLPDTLPEPALQYADYAVWQRQWLQGLALATQIGFWRKHLDGAPELLELPSDRPRPPQQSYAGGAIGFELSAELSAGLRQLSRRHGCTLFMTLLCGWSILMARLSGQRDVVIGTPVANRQHAEIEALIGFFVNTLALRVVMDDDPGVAQLLGRIKATTLSAYAHQDLPFEQVVEAVKPPRSMSHSPIFQVMLGLNNTPKTEALTLPGLCLTPLLRPSTTTQFDLALSLTEVDDVIVASLDYASDLFDAATVERWAGHWQVVLSGMVADDQQRINQLPLLTQAEIKHIVVDWNDTDADYAPNNSLHHLFEQQAEQTPDAVAVAFEGQCLSYAEVNAKANRLAHYLREQGAGPEVLIGLCLDRSPDMIIGLLGILKSGSAYVPLDPDYPEQRIAYMINDAGMPLLLTRRSLLEKLASCPSEIICLDRDWPEIERFDAENPVSRNHPLDTAYLIYTSGSTGQAKAVMVSHRNALHSTCARFFHYREPVQAFLLLSSFAFDSSVAGIFWTLAQGGRLCLPTQDDAKDPAALAKLIERHSVSHLLTLPGLYSVLLKQPLLQLQSLTAVIVAGETCSNDVVEQHFSVLPALNLYNEYGPTEGTVWSSVYGAAIEDVGRTLPIGKAIANVRIYLLDRTLSPVPVGVAGELYIGGEGVARGYLKRPALTAEKFVPDPFGRSGGRLYKTGDLARYRADGTIEFLGRIDHQVKIRGFRIELGEIEARLLQHSEVHEAVVLAREDNSGNRQLIAYVVGNSGASPEPDALREHLKARLPDYMLPNAFVFVDRMPLSANGKLERKALPAPDFCGQLQQHYVEPRTETEHILADIWAEVLGLERVGIRDNFFELGGHSLLATQLVSRLCRQFNIELPLKAIFEQGTVENIAPKIDLAVWAKNNEAVLSADDEVDYEEIEL